MGADAYFQAIKTIRLDLLELVGRSYVIEHCAAEINRSHHERSYQVYVTDTLKAIAEKMSVSELDELYRAFQKEKGAKVQLAPKTKINKSENLDFMI